MNKTTKQTVEIIHESAGGVSIVVDGTVLTRGSSMTECAVKLKSHIFSGKQKGQAKAALTLIKSMVVR